MQNDKVTVNGIKKRYGKHIVLKDINLCAYPGECIGIIGKNGCGKSTLLGIMSGCIKPDSGSIDYFGKNPLKNKAVFSQSVSFVPQDNPLIEQLTAKDNLKLWYPSSKALKNELRGGICKRFGIDMFLNKSVYKLSGGQKKRLSIACALSSRPNILILDEPTAALDLPCKYDIREYLRDFLSEGGIVFLTTHEEPEISICSRVYLMEEGVLNQIDSTSSLESLYGRMSEAP